MDKVVYKNRFDESVKVIGKDGVGKVIVEFPDGRRYSKYLCSLRKGTFTSPYTRTHCGVGFDGEGQYSCTSHKQAYAVWSWMLARCYNQETQITNPTYVGCSVDSSWHNFQNYAEWFYTEPYRQDGWEVDKDFRVIGNRVYSADTCTFIPKELNAFLTNLGGSNLGACWDERKHKFVARVGTRYVGAFKTKEAATEAYVNAKNQRAKEFVRKYGDRLHPDVLRTLTDFDVLRYNSQINQNC